MYNTSKITILLDVDIGIYPIGLLPIYLVWSLFTDIKNITEYIILRKNILSLRRIYYP